MLYFLLPFALTLPILRMISEAGEHPYELSWRTDETSVIAATVNNIGPIHRLLFHPFGDGFHLMHHLYPSIPGYRLSRAYEILSQEGGAFNQMKARYRILQAPLLVT